MKLKGFTILEVILSLAISALVLGIGVTGHFMTKGNYERYRTKTKGLSEINLFHYIFKRDFAQAITVSGNNTMIVCENGISAPTVYAFKQDYILRMLHQRTDTFNLSVTNLSFETLMGSDYVTSLAFRTGEKEKSLMFYQSKSYAADILMQLDKNGN